MDGGFAGVDVFFVISGFLMATIISAELEKGTFSFRKFWGRRIKRLFPVFATVLIATLIATYFFVFSDQWLEIARQAQWCLLLLANVKMMRLGGDYWGPAAESSPFLHIWSLAVEEHFYLCLPPLLFLLAKRPVRQRVIVLGAFALFSFIACIAITPVKPHWAFFLLPFRAWELLVGCVIALAGRVVWFRPSQSLLEIGAATGLALTLLSFFVCNSSSFPGYQASLPVAGSAILLATSAGSNWTNRLLSSSFLVSIGKLSYSLYLWHWPVIVLLRHAMVTSTPPVAYVLGISFLLSVATYALIENPIRYNRRWASINASLAIACITVVTTMQYSQRDYDVKGFDNVVWLGQIYDNRPTQQPLQGRMASRMRGIETPMREKRNSTTYRESGIIKRYGNETPEIVVFGDSHGLMWSDTIDEIAQQNGQTVCFFAASGTPLVFNEGSGSKTAFFTAQQMRMFDQARLNCIKSWKPDFICIASLWTKQSNSEFESLPVFISLLQKHCKQLVIIGQPPPLHIGDSNALRYAAYLRESAPSSSTLKVPIYGTEHYEQRMSQLSGFATKCRASFVPTNHNHSQNGKAVLADGNVIYYIDDDHLSVRGAKLYKSEIARVLTPDHTGIEN
ncbi:O-acetyltransferase OatA [Rosistilla oblonga]|nr:O-acetyltransferase OatA [Rosistilla oblonga]